MNQDFNSMYGANQQGAQAKKKGVSYSMYLNEKHLGHVNFNASVPAEVANKVITTIDGSTPDVLQYKLNDGTNVASFDVAGL